MNLYQNIQELFNKIPEKYKQILQIQKINNHIFVICLKPGAFKKDKKLNEDLYRCCLLQDLHNHFTSFNSTSTFKTAMRLQYNGTRALNYYIGTDMPEFLIKRAAQKVKFVQKTQENPPSDLKKLVKQKCENDPIFANLLLDEVQNPTTSPKGEPMFPARRRS